MELYVKISYFHIFPFFWFSNMILPVSQLQAQ